MPPRAPGKFEWKYLERDAHPDVTYIICTNPRTGSWLLADALNNTSVAGKPGEWFSELEEKKIRARYPNLSYENYVRFVCSQSCTPNGVSAIKMHHHDFNYLNEQQSVTIDEILPDNTKYIWLTRQNKARQAISYVLARATHEWWLNKNYRVIHDVEFDARKIAEAEQQLIDRDAEWQSFFTRTNITPLLLNYEDDLECNYQQTVIRVLGWLGITDTVEISTQLRRQSDQRNEDWLVRYMEER